MLVSWEWLQEYIHLELTPDALAQRFAMTGLNHESTSVVDGDPVIDLEVTSNRGDCLGHIGIAREAAVLTNVQLCLPKADLSSAAVGGASAASQVTLTNEFPEGCDRYVGRLIRGVKVGPSPAWLIRRLKSIGVNSVNNVVDATNYVMFECGQPLHAFDLAKIRGGRVIVRRGAAKESFVAIDHRTYELDTNTVVIADAEGAIAIGGVMGGVNSEVTPSTTDLLIESAAFSPLAIRRTARRLRLHSPASYRFERRVDATQLEWAANRCCQLIVQLAGGQCSPDTLATNELKPNPTSIRLRMSRIAKVLGLDVPWEQAVDILRSLGCVILPADATLPERAVHVTVPTFRVDLQREIDLIEEIARIYGYDRIPENASVPIMISQKRPKDILLDRTRAVATASGLDEALTPSVINKQANDLASMWTQSPALQTQTPLLEGTTYLRRSLAPSLLQVYQLNQSLQQKQAAVFEIATVYLANNKGLPDEKLLLGMVGPLDLREMVGTIESIIERIVGFQNARKFSRAIEPLSGPMLLDDSAAWVVVDGQRIGWFGMLSPSIKQMWKIDSELSIAEVDLGALLNKLEIVPTLTPVMAYPSIERDLNLVLNESTSWNQIESIVREAAGPLLTECSYRETYRDAKKDGEQTKRILFSMAFQSPERTLTSDEVDVAVAQVLASAAAKLDAKLIAQS